MAQKLDALSSETPLKGNLSVCERVFICKSAEDGENYRLICNVNRGINCEYKISCLSNLFTTPGVL